MKWKAPLKEDWDCLYQEALKFRKLKPWLFFQNEDIYCIEEPESNMPIFCSIMGAGDEYFGISAYIGLKGLESIRKIIAEENHFRIEEEIYDIHSLLCSYESWEDLLIEEQIQAEKYDPKLKVDEMCPGFISYEPGYVPFSLSREECRLMTMVLKQSFNIVKHKKDDSCFLSSLHEQEILARKYHYTNKKGTRVWKNEWTVFPPYIPPFDIMHIQNPEIKERLTAYPQSDVIWEVEALYMPFVIEEGFKPYYPKMLFVVDHHSGHALSPALCRDAESPKDKFLSHFISLLDQCRFRPKAIMARNEKNINLFSMVCAEVGIKLLQESSLPKLDEMKTSLVHDFSQIKNTSSTVH